MGDLSFDFISVARSMWSRKHSRGHLVSILATFVLLMLLIAIPAPGSSTMKFSVAPDAVVSGSRSVHR